MPVAINGFRNYYRKEDVKEKANTSATLCVKRTA